jgi:glutaredoxin 3
MIEIDKPFDELMFDNTIRNIKLGLNSGVVALSFFKKNGTVRKVKATTKFNLIPEADHPKGDGSYTDKQLRFFSLEDKAWRSCLATSIISANLIPNYTVYWRESCGYCVAAKRLLDEKGISYDAPLVGRDVSREELLAKFPSMTTVPIIYDNVTDTLIGGYTELAAKLAA